MGNITQYIYDGVGNVIEVIDPMGNSIHYEYDGLSRLVRVNAGWSNPLTGASGFQQTIYQFNGRGLLVTEINALGAQRTHEYDAVGNAIITIDEDGNVIEREFNPLNLVSAVTADDVLLGFVYDKTGRLVSMTDATGETNFLLDQLYRIIEVQDSFGRVTEYAYDPVGNLISVIYPDASIVTYTHNRNNQVLTITDPDGGVTRNVYDSYGRLARQYLPNGGHTEFSYNTLNQLTQQREIFNHRTTRQFSYGYTDNGLLHTETIQFFGIDNENTNRMFLYDANGRLFSSSDTLLGRTDYYFDSMGNLVRETRDGVTTTFTHNAMNQLLTRIGPDGHFVYTYDQRGNLISESRNGVQVRTFEYDTLGRMIRGTNELGETSEYLYNALGLRVANVQRILPGHMGGHGWDVNGYLTDEPNSPGSRHINVNRQALSGLPSTVWLEGFADADSANAIDRYLWQGELPEDIPNSAYQRIFKDNFGLNRNSGVVRQEFVIDYVMGFNQDLMLVEEGGFSTVFVYGTPLQRLSQHTSRADSIVSGVAAVGGALDPGGNVAADIAVLPVYSVLYYRLDFRNSTSQMQLPNGQYIAWAGYDDWGATTSRTDHDMNMAGVDPIRFSSYNFDRVLGLFYAQNRWYDPTIRRWLSPDPHWSQSNMILGDNPVLMPNAAFLPDFHAVLQSTNLYAYVANNPVNFIDPRGLVMEWTYSAFEEVPSRQSTPPSQQLTATAQAAAANTPQSGQNLIPGQNPSLPPAQPVQNNTAPIVATPRINQGINKINAAADSVLADAGAELPASSTGYFNSAGCNFPPSGVENWRSRALAAASDFGRGVASGASGFFVGIPDAATAHVNNILNNPIRASWEFKVAIAMSPITKVQNLYNAAQGGAYELGVLYGEHLAQGGTMAVGYGAGRLAQTAYRATTTTGNWTNLDGSIRWPANDGFVGRPTVQTLQPGTVVDRLGAPSGRFVAPAGTPAAQRSLAPGTSTQLSVYEVVRPVQVQAGTTAPWFNQPGGGIQFKFDVPTSRLVDQGILRRIN